MLLASTRRLCTLSRWVPRFVALVLIIASWNIYLFKCRITARSFFTTTPFLMLMEVFSALIGGAGLALVVNEALPSEQAPVMRQREGKYRDGPSSTLALESDQHENAKGFRGHHTSFKASQLLRIFLATASLEVLVHVSAHVIVQDEHNLTQELLLGTMRIVVDTGFVIALYTILLVRREIGLMRSTSESQQKRALIECLLVSSVLLVLVYLLASYIMSVDTMRELHRTISQVPLYDVCTLEGGHAKESITTSFVLPKLIPSWIFRPFSGSSECSSSSWRSGGFIASDEWRLIIPSVCLNGHVPRVLLERPEVSAFNGGGENFVGPKFATANWKYHMQLEERYGLPALSENEKVLVRRHKDTGRILEVEIDPKELRAVVRTPRSKEEEKSRAGWVKTVLEIPLGRSAAYTVVCGETEELFMFPMNLTRFSASETSPIPTEGTPAGSALVFFFDAVSRQAMTRAMPKFSRWIRRFGSRKSTSGGHLVVENLAHTTIGYNTVANFVPMLSGTSEFADESRTSIMNSTVFNLVKSRYGNTVDTAFISGFCESTFEELFFSSTPSAGIGETMEGVDRYFFHPMCHNDYGYPSNNFQGPFSMRRRCIAGRHVHEHVLDYTRDVLRIQLEKQRSRTNPSFFFDVVYFLEGHEASQSVLPRMDDALTEFMEMLETKMGFFENPLNTFVLVADHGNHMGYYMTHTQAGKLERASPMLLHLIHPDAMNRIDVSKGFLNGVSQRDFVSRSHKLSSPMDLYLSFCDLMNVTATPHPSYMSVKVPPKSLFESRPQRFRSCDDFHLPHMYQNCILEFCDG